MVSQFSHLVFLSFMLERASAVAEANPERNVESSDESKGSRTRHRIPLISLQPPEEPEVGKDDLDSFSNRIPKPQPCEFSPQGFRRNKRSAMA
jgi:hypothetical protein